MEEAVCDPVPQTSHKVSPDQFGFITNLETFVQRFKKIYHLTSQHSVK